MIVSRKHIDWKNLKGHYSRLSGYCWSSGYYCVTKRHRLYGSFFGIMWHVNGKCFIDFKETS